jgi:hypothetical protein
LHKQYLAAGVRTRLGRSLPAPSKFRYTKDFDEEEFLFWPDLCTGELAD